MADETTTVGADPVEERAEGEYWASEEEVADSVAKRRKLADKAQSDWREEATDIYAFVAGDQWSEEDQKYREDVLKRPAVTFNRVGPIINAVCGQQVCNRQETRFLPREAQDMQTAELWSQVVAWAREQCDAEDEESDAFRDLIVTGIGWTCTTVAYDEDPAGRIMEQRTDPRRLRWDPASRKKNLADARWVQCDYWWTREQVREKWPESEDIAIEPSAFVNDEGFGQPHDATNAWRYTKSNSAKDLVNNQYRCIHDLHWRLEDIYQIADVDGSITKLSEDEWEQLSSRLATMGLPAPQVAKTQARVYYEAWMVGGTVLEYGRYPGETGFEYQAMTGLRDERGQWYGLAKSLLDPQRFANKIFTEIVAIIGSNAKGGIMVEEGAVTNKRKFEQEWSKSDGVSWLLDGAVSNGRVQAKPPPQIPAELTKLLEYSIGGLREVTGVNVEFLGQTDKVQPGVVEAMRTKAGLIILAPWFDAMRLYMKRQGRLLAEYINRYIADNRWVRITGQQGPQFVQLAKQPDVLRYDIVVDEATQSRDSRERYFQGLMQIMPMAMQSGMPIPPEVIDYAPLPETLRMKWKDMLMKKMSEPPQPPIALEIERMRGDTQKQIEGMRAQSKEQLAQMEAGLDQQKMAMEAQAERVVQAAQAESQRMVDASKLQLDMMTGAMKSRSDEQKMVLDAKLTLFETILNAMVEANRSEREDRQAVARESEKAAAQPGTAERILPEAAQIVTAQQEMLQVMMDALTAPREAMRDASGKLIGARRRMKRPPESATAATLALWQQLAAPHEAVRGPDGRITEARPRAH